MDPLGMMAGLRVIEDASMADIREDWSRVRSPSRAARRRKKGYRQNIDYVLVPKTVVIRLGNTLVMHPEIARKLRQTVKEPRP